MQILRSNIIKILGILILSFIVFSPSINGDFLNWDDTIYITGNELLNDNISIESFLKLYENDAYISLTLFSFQVQTKIFGNDPYYFHLINILIHLANVFLVFYLSKILFPNRNFAFWVALVFAIHPFKVESVAWIIQRKDLLYSMFFLTGIITYIKFIKTDKIFWYFISMVLAYLAIISKVAAISFVFSLVAIEYFLQNRVPVKSMLLILIIGFLQLNHINFVFIASFFVVIPMILVRYFNNLYLNKDNSSNSLSNSKKTKHIINKFLASKKTYKLLLYFFLFAAVINAILSLVKIFLYQETTFSIGFFFQIITWFLPFIILFMLSSRYQIFIYDLIDKIKVTRKAIVFGIIASISAITFIYFFAMQHFEQGEFTLSNIISLQTIIYFSFSLVYYLFGFIFPFYQNSMYPYPDSAQFSLILKLSPFILVALSYAIYYLFKKIKDKSFRKEIGFGLLFFLINIVIVLHIIPIRGRVIVAERYSYLAYLGLVFSFVIVYKYLLNLKSINKNIVRFSMIALVMIYSVQSFTRSQVYKNSYSFWSDVIAKNPNNHYAIFAIGLDYFEKSDYMTAIQKYSDAINLYPNNYEYFLNRGSCYFKIDSIHKALIDYNIAIELNSSDYLAYKNRGIIYYKTGDFQAAIVDFEKCLELNDQEKEVTQLYKEAKTFLSEYSTYETTGKSSYSLSNYYFGIATNYAKKSDYIKSLKMFNESLKYDSLNIDALKNRGNVYAIIQNYTAALSDYQHAIDIKPDDAGLYINLGNILHQLGDINAACENWNIASELGRTESQKMIDQFCK
jgi:tetratricopeptide (TPR) repeat protein